MLTFDEIVRKSQHTLKKALVSELDHMGYRTRTKRGFTYAKGSLPVLLVAHLDTVHEKQVKTICRSDDGKIVMSPEGIGGDDRAGVYMILQIIKKHRCHVLFCEDEETGGAGASEFVKSRITPDVNYIVELDRHGSNDAVFYDCSNPDFTEFVTGFGFREAIGSFSDISIIAPELKVAAVNISAGYYSEHSRHEFVDMDAVTNNINRVGKMVSTKSQKFEYIEDVCFGRWFNSGRFHGKWADFDAYFGSPSCEGIKLLTQVPDSAHIRTSNGDMIECDGQYLIDERGKVYEYLYNLDVAVEAPDCVAMTENNFAVKFDPNDSLEIEVVPIEYIVDTRENGWGH